MKIVANECYGCFELSKFAKEVLGTDGEHILRNDKRLISLIEEYGAEKVGTSSCCFVIKEIPDEATDWRIEDYDGAETVWYVIDGKMHEVPWEDC